MKTLILLLSLLATTALAQAGGAVEAPAPVTDAPRETPSEPANTLTPDTDKLGFLQGKVEALEEQFAETNAVVAALSKIKLSGYVQARYQNAENSASGVDGAGNPLVKDGFTVRYGRLAAEYRGTVARYFIQIDAVPSGVSLRDAEAGLTEPWTGKQMFSLTLGQTKWPFGYEAVQSDTERELPERSRVIRAFFPNERDRGVKVSFKYGPVRAWLGAFDGNGIGNKGFVGVDNDKEKDLYGRVAVDFKWIAGGISASTGKTLRPESPTAQGKFFDRNRIGVDVQAYLDLFPFGSTAIKGELVAGTTYQVSNVEQFGRTALGWYALIVQNIGKHEQAAIRYDYFDPATGVLTAVDSKDPTKPASTNPVQTVGFVVSHYFDEVLKASVVYEIPIVATTGTTDVAPRQNLFTLQLQAKF